MSNNVYNADSKDLEKSQQEKIPDGLHGGSFIMSFHPNIIHRGSHKETVTTDEEEVCVGCGNHANNYNNRNFSIYRVLW